MPSNNFSLISTVNRTPNQSVDLIASFTFGIPTPAFAIQVTSPSFLIGKYVGRVYGFAYVNLGSSSNVATLFNIGALVYPQTLFSFPVPTAAASNGGMFIGWGAGTENASINVYQSP